MSQPERKVNIAPQRNHQSARGTSFWIAPLRTGASVSAKNGRLDEVEVVEQADPGDPGQEVDPPQEEQPAFATRQRHTVPPCACGSSGLDYSRASAGCQPLVGRTPAAARPGRSAHQLRSRGVRAGEDGGGGRTRTSGTGLMRPRRGLGQGTLREHPDASARAPRRPGRSAPRHAVTRARIAIGGALVRSHSGQRAARPSASARSSVQVSNLGDAARPAAPRPEAWAAGPGCAR